MGLFRVFMLQSYKWIGWVWDGLDGISVWGYCMSTACGANNDPCCQIQSLNFKFWGFAKAVTGAALEAIWKLSEQSMFIYCQFVVRGTVL